jgi:methyl-accepting chemotaxis protein
LLIILENQLTLIERKLDTHLAAQAACYQPASDSTTAACCETKQATIWKPTSFTAMFELVNNRILQLESLVASTADLGAVIDDNNAKLQNRDCLAQLQRQFNERMANMKTLLEMTTSHTIEERNGNIISSSEQNSTDSPVDQLQTVIKVISQEPENSPIDKCELLKCYLDSMATACIEHDEKRM